MSRNSSGTYTLPSGNPVVSGTVIEASWANSTLNDISDALTDSLSRSGKGGMTAPFRLIDGTVSAPAFAFANETGSGAYRAAAGDWYLTVLGSNVLRLRSNAVDVTGSFGTGNLTYTGTLTGSTGVINIGSGQIYKDASGNVGFGKTPSGYQLDMSGLARINNATVIGAANVEINAGGSGNRYSYVDFVSDDTYTDFGLRVIRGNVGANSVSEIIHRGTGLFQITAQEAASIAFATSTAERMRIDASGNVLVGTTSQIQGGKLSVYGNIGWGAGSTGRIYADANWQCLLQGSGSGTTPFGFADSIGNIRMAIDSSGNVGIGTTSPISKVEVLGGQLSVSEASAAGNAGGQLSLCAQNNSGTRLAVGYIKGALNNGGVSTYSGDISFGTALNNTYGERMRLAANGVLTINGGQINLGSSIIYGNADANWGILYQPNKNGNAAAHGFLNASGAAAAYITGAGNFVAIGTIAGTALAGGAATGAGASGTWGINITGNANSASQLTTGQSNWQSTNVNANVVGMLTWRNYGNGHVIFDASGSISPSGGAVNNTNPVNTWTATYPTLMAWNGSTTFGVRVDSCRYADSLATVIGSAPSYACRAWVNFNGTGTLAGRASGNVSSIVDNGVGDYTINFATAMPDANYVVTQSVSNDNGSFQGPQEPQWAKPTNRSAGAVRVWTYFHINNSGLVAVDTPQVNVAIYR